MTSEQFIDGSLTLIVGAVAGYLWWRGTVERLLGQRGFIFVAIGMTLVLMGLILDLADDFPTLQRYVYSGNDPFADKLRWYGGYILGGLFILVGFTQWVPINVALRNTQRGLMRSNEELQAEMLERPQAESALAGLQLRLADVQEDERRNIARELHDDLGQELTGLKFIVEQAMQRDDGHNEVHAKRQVEIIDRLFAKVRDLSLNLRPSVLDDLGLVPALEWLVRHHSQDSDLRVEFNHNGVEDRLSPRTENAAYRIVQEGLTNVVRHAKTSQARLDFSVTNGLLRIVVADDGVGFDSEKHPDTTDTVGLPAMRERVDALGGTLTVDSSPSDGTTLKVELPLDTDQ